jgi:transcriptional antiterminator RfaH
MPLLPLEPYIFPDGLLGDPFLLEGTANRWWVLHTRPRAEKTLARRLLRQNIPFFLPLYQRTWRSHGRVLESHNPLFPGYVFVQASEDQRSRVLQTKLVARSLPVDDQGQLHEDLFQVFKLISAGVSLAPEDRLRPGTCVEITSGPLTGLTGKFLGRGKHQKVLVEVHFLQRGVSVELEGWSVRPL